MAAPSVSMDFRSRPRGCSLGSFCDFAASENIRLRWRGRVNQARTRYRIQLSVEVARHVCHEWSDVFPLERPLPEALEFLATKYQPFYRDLIDRHRCVETFAREPALMAD